MPYSINKSDGTPLVTVQDNTVNTTASSLTLIGRNSVNFGQAIDQDFVYLLQNFAATTPPSNPLIGQLYYNTYSSSLTLFDGAQWRSVVSPFDGTSGTATALVGPNNVSVSITVSQNQIISISSATYIAPSSLPSYIVIDDTRYYLNSLFPGGIYPGINLATGVQLTGTASSANSFTTGRTIALTGVANGNVVFDGSTDVELNVSFANVYVGNTNVTVAGTYTKVTVSDGGYITGGGNLVSGDVAHGLGYVPYNGANIEVGNYPNTIVSRDNNGNFAANIMAGTSTSAMGLAKPIMFGINGDVIGAASFDGASNITIQTELVAIEGLVPGTYNTVNVDNKGRVVGGALIPSPPLGSMVLYTDPSYIPPGWILCNGQVVTNASGTFITPNLTGISMCGAFYIMRVQ